MPSFHLKSKRQRFRLHSDDTRLDLACHVKFHVYDNAQRTNSQTFQHKWRKNTIGMKDMQRKSIQFKKKELSKSAFLRITMQRNDDRRIYGQNSCVFYYEVWQNLSSFSRRSLESDPGRNIFSSPVRSPHSFSIIFLSLFVCHERCVISPRASG